MDWAEAIGGIALAHICLLFARDYSGWSGGLPDLALRRSQQVLDKVLKPGREVAGRFMLVEVKGPRDRLSSQQLAWLEQLGRFLPVQVLHVKEPPLPAIAS